MSTFVAPNLAGLPVPGGLRFQVGRALHAVWRGMERVGQARAAAELQRLADERRGIDAKPPGPSPKRISSGWYF